MEDKIKVKKKLTLKERKERMKEQLESLNKQISTRAKKILGNIFYDLMKDEKLYEILEERSQDKEFKEKLNPAVKKLILELVEEELTNPKDEVQNEKSEG
ncbi:hypothetical protein [Cetobacterium sp.]|uniref:hypothetical protein n=1 Tax=Cetobacterium sp. TaxID=2071632 RepID=UPI0025BB2A69|nr:hypothetical protein [Cetobacterium sp.]